MITTILIANLLLSSPAPRKIELLPDTFYNKALNKCIVDPKCNVEQAKTGYWVTLGGGLGLHLASIGVLTGSYFVKSPVVSKNMMYGSMAGVATGVLVDIVGQIIYNNAFED